MLSRKFYKRELTQRLLTGKPTQMSESKKRQPDISKSLRRRSVLGKILIREPKKISRKLSD